MSLATSVRFLFSYWLEIFFLSFLYLNFLLLLLNNMMTFLVLYVLFCC